MAGYDRRPSESTQGIAPSGPKNREEPFIVTKQTTKTVIALACAFFGLYIFLAALWILTDRY